MEDLLLLDILNCQLLDLSFVVLLYLVELLFAFRRHLLLVLNHKFQFLNESIQGSDTFQIVNLIDGTDVDDDRNLLQQFEGLCILGLNRLKLWLVQRNLGFRFLDLFLSEVGLLLLHFEWQLFHFFVQLLVLIYSLIQKLLQFDQWRFVTDHLVLQWFLYDRSLFDLRQH